MPGFDGTGPSGQGPMTGRGRGFCILRISEEKPGELEGLAGSHGVPLRRQIEKLKNVGQEAIPMPFGDGTGPAGLGSVAGRGAGLPVPGNAKPVAGKTGFYGSGMLYGGRVTRWFRRAFGLGRDFGRGRGRGRCGFGYWW